MQSGISVIEACMNALKQQAFYGAYDNTFEIVRADTDSLKEQVFRLRYQVFCEEHNCDSIDSYGDGILIDPHDDHSVHFLLRHKETGEVAGATSVVMPREDRDGHSFPVQQICDHPLLHMPQETRRLCEISRLCMAPRFRRRPEDGRFLPAYYPQDWGLKFNHGKVTYIRRRIPYAPLGLLRAAFETALSSHLMDCVCVIESEQLRTLQELGMSYRVLGPRLQGRVSFQPVIFNIKIALDTMREDNPHCYDIVSDKGRLSKMADEINKHYWLDEVFSQDCWDEIYNKLL